MQTAGLLLLDWCVCWLCILTGTHRAIIVQVDKLGDECTASARAILAVLQYLAVVLVQDACDLLSSDDADIKAAAEANPLHKLLLKEKAFTCDLLPSLSPAWLSASVSERHTYALDTTLKP